MPGEPRYEDDLYAWTQFQAEVLRALPVSDNRFDRERGAEAALPTRCPFTLDDVLQPGWYPKPAEKHDEP